jgi:sortase A
MRPVLRFLASVMMVSGVLLITDAGITLLWQEPVSAVVAEREQAALKDALFDPPERVLRRKPLKGDAIARLEIPAIGVSEYVVPGNVIRVDMPDGRFVYRVEEVRIVDDQDLSVLDPVGYRRLMLSACHPLYSAAERVIVFARQVRRGRSRVRPS